MSVNGSSSSSSSSSNGSCEKNGPWNGEKPMIYYPPQGHGNWNMAVASDLLGKVERSSEERSSSSSSKGKWEYGTAGFRYPHEILEPIMVRMGWLSVARCSVEDDSHHVGMMITASHNPEKDNGLKLADPSDGGMLHPDWEIKAVELANASHPLELLRTSTTTTMTKTHKAVVHVGMDTRSHSPKLAQLAVESALSAGAIVIHHGYVTTPQLHYMVKHANSHSLPSLQSPRPGQSGYYNTLANSYLQLLSTATYNNNSSSSNHQPRVLTVDCACGVGGWKLQYLQHYLQTHAVHYPHCNNTAMAVQCQLVNLPGDGPLNDACGAEYVQKQQKPFQIYNNTSSHIPKQYMCSFDGDADRIVFSYYDDQYGKFHLLDGDKIAVLVSMFIQQELQHLIQCISPNNHNTIQCGVVQTAYANGSSTHYLKNVVKTKVVIAKTGVKYVHAAAHDHFDIGTYFEANGHGTVLFGPKFYQFMAQAESYFLHNNHSHNNNNHVSSSRAKVAWRRLQALPSLINQAVGDALSDMLLVDAILVLMGGWKCDTWNALYTDLPSKQLKVRVKDRSMIVTNDNETKAVRPTTLQPALEESMSFMKQSRVFVRPSGTENVVRIYAEASTTQDANSLATLAALHVHRLCDGVGPPPKPTISSNL